MLTAQQLQECPLCQTEARTPFLVDACASIGVDYGLSTGQMLMVYLAGFHERGHAGGYHARMQVAYARAQQHRRRSRPVPPGGRDDPPSTGRRS